MNIEHVGIYATDSNALAEWYRTVLGLREIRRLAREGQPAVIFLQGDDGAVVEILPTANASVKRDLKAPGYTHLGVQVRDLARERERLAVLGIEMWGLRETSNGWTIGYFSDPEGNTLELIQR